MYTVTYSMHVELEDVHRRTLGQKVAKNLVAVVQNREKRIGTREVGEEIFETNIFGSWMTLATRGRGHVAMWSVLAKVEELHRLRLIRILTYPQEMNEEIR